MTALIVPFSGFWLTEKGRIVQASLLYLHQQVSEDLKSAQVVWASKKMADIVCTALQRKGTEVIANVLRQLKKYNLSGNVRSDLFECWGLRQLAQGGMFQRKCLSKPCLVTVSSFSS